MSSLISIKLNWFLLAAILMVLTIIANIQAQEIEDDVTFTSPKATTDNNVPRRRHYSRYNQWMKLLTDFFMDGNWMNGGPDNLIEYITRFLSKLLDLLMNRGIAYEPSNTPFRPNEPQPVPENEPNDFTYNTRVWDSSPGKIQDIFRLFSTNRMFRNNNN